MVVLNASMWKHWTKIKCCFFAQKLNRPWVLGCCSLILTAKPISCHILSSYHWQRPSGLPDDRLSATVPIYCIYCITIAVTECHLTNIVWRQYWKACLSYSEINPISIPIQCIIHTHIRVCFNELNSGGSKLHTSNPVRRLREHYKWKKQANL